MAQGRQHVNNLKDKNSYYFIGDAYKINELTLSSNYISGKGYSYTLDKTKAKRSELN